MENEPKLLTAHLASDQVILVSDVLEIGGELWIVSSWLETQDGQWRTPDIAIRADQLQHQRPGPFGSDLLFSYPIPKGVLDGTPSPEEAGKFEVVRGPSDRFPLIPKRRVS